MKCKICQRGLNSTERRPKSLPCGHTVCLGCLRRLKTPLCPMCRQVFPAPAEALPDNLFILGLLQEANPQPSGVWCQTCNSVASGDCVEAGHPVCCQRKLAASLLQQLRDAAAVARKVVWALQDARDAVDAQLQEWQAVLQKVEEALTVAVDAGLDLAAVQNVDGLERLPDVATMLDAKCELQVQLWDRDGHEWKGDLQQPAAGGAWLMNPVVLYLFGNITKVKRHDPATAAMVDFSNEERLDVTKYTPRKNCVQNLDVVLQYSNLFKVRRLVGVNCSKWPNWSKMLLWRVAPHIVLLRVDEALPDHLDAIQHMPALRYLDVLLKTSFVNAPGLPLQLEDLIVVNVAAQHLLSVQHMANLRKLCLHWSSRPLEVTFPPLPPDYLGLQWLWAALQPMSTVLSLVKAHAATLVELRITCASEGDSPWRFKDLAEGLRQCGLVRLRRLVLLRRPVYGFPGNTLPHRQVSCRLQKAEVRYRMRADHRVLKVLCEDCDRCPSYPPLGDFSWRD